MSHEEKGIAMPSALNQSVSSRSAHSSWKDKVSFWKRGSDAHTSQQKSLANAAAYIAYPQTYMLSNGKPVRMQRSYLPFAEEGYQQNVIAHRCVKLLAQAIANVPFQVKLSHKHQSVEADITHPVYRLLNRPMPGYSRSQWLEALVSQ